MPSTTSSYPATQYSPKHPPRPQHHAENSTPPRLTPSSPVKDHTRANLRSRANCFPRSISLPPEELAAPPGALPPRCSRGASAPLSHFATNDASHRLRGGGGDRNRTDDLLLAKQALSQLSYTPSVLGKAQNPIRRQRLREQPREPPAGALTEPSLVWVPLSRCKRTAVAARDERRSASFARGGPGRI
jgi:hypothetical protein